MEVNIGLSDQICGRPTGWRSTITKMVMLRATIEEYMGMRQILRFLSPNLGFFETYPVQSRTQKTLLLPADAAGKRPGQSATTIATAGNIPCVYHHAASQRQLLADEQQTSLAARHYPHRNIHRRQDLSLDAVRPTAGKNSLPHHHIGEYRS